MGAEDGGEGVEAEKPLDTSSTRGNTCGLCDLLYIYMWLLKSTTPCPQAVTLSLHYEPVALSTYLVAGGKELGHLQVALLALQGHVPCHLHEP